MDDYKDTSRLRKINSRHDGKTREERRQSVRKFYFVPVDYSTPDRAYSEFIRDVSERGVFIETKHLISPGQKIELTFSLPGHNEPFNLMGKVIRAHSTGIGVSFIPLDGPLKSLVSSCIKEI